MKVVKMQRYEKDGRKVPKTPGPRGQKANWVCVAGVVGKVTKFLGQVIDPRPPNIRLNGIVDDGSSKGTKSKPRAEYLYFEVEVEKLESEYPEDGERIRKWVPPARTTSGR